MHISPLHTLQNLSILLYRAKISNCYTNNERIISTIDFIFYNVRQLGRYYYVYELPLLKSRLCRRMAWLWWNPTKTILSYDIMQNFALCWFSIVLSYSYFIIMCMQQVIFNHSTLCIQVDWRISHITSTDDVSISRVSRTMTFYVSHVNKTAQY